MQCEVCKNKQGKPASFPTDPIYSTAGVMDRVRLFICTLCKQLLEHKGTKVAWE